MKYDILLESCHQSRKKWCKNIEAFTLQEAAEKAIKKQTKDLNWKMSAGWPSLGQRGKFSGH